MHHAGRPENLKVNTARLTAMLGKNTSQGDTSTYFCPVIDSMPPKEGTSGGVPTPRKERAASTTTA